MMLKKTILAAASILLCTQIAAASTYDQFVAFGDSTIDTGWFANTSTGIPIFDGAIAASIAAGGNAHFTGPGPNWTQLVAGALNLTANPANAPGGGTNYAIGGAYSYQGGANAFFGTPPSTTSGNIGFNPSLPGTATQIGNYLTSVAGIADSHALYVISSGGNDLFYASTLSTAAATMYLQSEATALAASIQTLQTDGANHILISNEYTSLAMLPLHDILFNALQTDLQTLGVNYLFADTTSLIAQVAADPSEYGITNITSNACAAAPGFAAVGVTTGYGETCAPTTTPSGLFFGYGNLVSPDALSTYLLMDGIHLTEAGEIITADYVDGLLGITPTPLPSTWVLMLPVLSLFGFAVYRKQTNGTALANA